MSTRANVAGDEATASDPPGGPSRLPDHNGRLAVFDLDRTLLPGSNGRFTGRLEGPFCHGPGKLARLWAELGTSDLSGATAYSDSIRPHVLRQPLLPPICRQ